VIIVFSVTHTIGLGWEPTGRGANAGCRPKLHVWPPPLASGLQITLTNKEVSLWLEAAIRDENQKVLTLFACVNY